MRIDREGGLAEFQHGGGDCFREALAIAGRAAGWNRIWYRSVSVLTRISNDFFTSHSAVSRALFAVADSGAFLHSEKPDRESSI